MQLLILIFIIPFVYLGFGIYKYFKIEKPIKKADKRYRKGYKVIGYTRMNELELKMNKDEAIIHIVVSSLLVIGEFFLFISVLKK